MQFPATATIVQNKLGMAGCPAFDVAAVCAGFMYALTTAHAYIKSGMAQKALVIGAETFSRILDWNDRTTCVLLATVPAPWCWVHQTSPALSAVNCRPTARIWVC